ncbi:MAG: NAD(P)/FAD-dependent oxidoreductase [Candidatus Acidiferrales bacterium]
MSPPKEHNPWGKPPWQIDFNPPRQVAPAEADFAVIGAGFTGLAAAAWLRLLAPDRSVVVLEAGSIGFGASGRTGGLTLAESAAADLPGLGDVLAGLRTILERFSAPDEPSLAEHAQLSLGGVWEVARTGKHLPAGPIAWNDSGTLHVVKEVPGGTVDPGKLVSALGRAAHRLGAVILENHRVERIEWHERTELRFAAGGRLCARKILFSTNALSLGLSGLGKGVHPKLTLAVATAPLRDEQLDAIGWSERKAFYTADLPYLWGRVLPDNSTVWGAGLVDAPDEEGDLLKVDVAAEGPRRIFESLEERVRCLHPALRDVTFTHRWGGPILFRDSWTPIFTWHRQNEAQSRNAIVLGGYAGHGVALSSYLGAWAAEALLGKRDLPMWGQFRS